MPPPVTPFSSVIAGFNGFIDPHLYGAKGDMVQYSDVETYASNWIGTPSGHVFTDADVGKPLYADWGGSPFSIIAVDKVLNRVQLNKTVTSGLTGRNCFWGTDDTAALRLALLAAKLNLGGGIAGSSTSSTKNQNYGKCVKLRAGASYLVKNSSADYAGGKVAALQLPRRTSLIGGGVGPRQSNICVAPDSYGHGIANEEILAYDDFNTIANLCVRGFKGFGAANVLDGIHLEIAFNSYSETDAFTNMFDVDIVGFTRDGLYLQGRGEGVFRNVRALSNGRYGIYAYRSMDSKFIECNAGGNSLTGIRVDACASVMFMGCKSFFNGSAGGTNVTDCANWHIWSDDGKNSAGVYNTCESQESRGSGWVLEGAGRMMMTNCIADQVGRSIVGTGTRPTICSGFHFKQGTVSPYHISIRDCRVSGGAYGTPNWGYGTDAVYLETGTSALHGNIELMPEITYSGSLNVSPGSYGKVAGPGATNGLNTRLLIDGVALT
jgi:hypothetical protein